MRRRELVICEGEGLKGLVLPRCSSEGEGLRGTDVIASKRDWLSSEGRGSG